MKDKSVLLYLLRKLRRRIPALALLTAAHMGSALFGVAFALGTKGVINAAVGGRTEDFQTACFLQLAIILCILLCLTLSRYFHDRLAADLDRDWKRDLFARLLLGDYDKVSQYHSGELINRLNNDVRAVNDGLLSSVPGLAAMVTRLVGAAAALGALAPAFAAALLAAGVTVIVITALVRRKLRDLHKAVSASEGRLSGFLQEVLEKLMPVQAMGVECEVQRRSEVLLEERCRLQRRRRGVSLLANSFVSILSYGSGFAALVWCSVGMLQGTMTFGDLTAITQLVSQLQGPLVNLSGFFPKYVAMTAAAERLMEIDALCSRQEPEEAREPWALYREMQCLRAEDLSFSYGRDQVLNPSTFTLPKGAFAVVTGPSGIGKSTLLKLLLGIFPPEGGSVAVRGSFGEIPLDRTTRSLFAYVPQGNLLFSGTLRENLTLTRPDAGEEAIREAVYASGMDEFLPQLPDGLETVLGENAQGLSEGQAQRLAIARAVLGGAPILLLDEATSALDAETEQTVLNRLRQLPERTCIAVTHRPAALALADWRLELQAGTIRALETQRGGGTHGNT